MGNVVLPSVEEIQAIFFESGIAGWAGDITPMVVPCSSGSHLIPWSSGPWEVSDIYWTTTHSQTSFGVTVISYDHQPVWRMSYEGWYREEAIPFLKEALLTAYRAGEFIGGRGPRKYQKDRLVYINEPSRIHESFDFFEGGESIEERFEDGDDYRTNPLGFHKYHGGLL